MIEIWSATVSTQLIVALTRNLSEKCNISLRVGDRIDFVDFVNCSLLFFLNTIFIRDSPKSRLVVVVVVVEVREVKGEERKEKIVSAERYFHLQYIRLTFARSNVRFTLLLGRTPYPLASFLTRICGGTYHDITRSRRYSAAG